MIAVYNISIFLSFMVQSIFEMVQWYNGTLCTALNVTHTEKVDSLVWKSLTTFLNRFTFYSNAAGNISILTFEINLR